VTVNKYVLKGREVVKFDGDLNAWAEWSCKEENRRIASDIIDEHYVSTVFLGSDHSYGTLKAPIVFETMIFGPDGRTIEGPDGHEYQERCCTYDEAEAMHADACLWVKKRNATHMDDTREYLKTVTKDNK